MVSKKQFTIKVNEFKIYLTYFR